MYSILSSSLTSSIMVQLVSSVILFLSLIVPTLSLSDLARNGQARSQCVVSPSNSSDIDDVPAILDALTTCGSGGRVTFINSTYHINSVMNTSWLNDVEIDLQGTLLVSKQQPTITHLSCSYLQTLLNWNSGAPTSPTG